MLAAKLVGHAGDITRFPSRDHFASYTGTAPVEASSGDVRRHRLNRGGNRQLNTALHLIAVCQIRDPGPGQAYYRRKLDRGQDPGGGPPQPEAAPRQRRLQPPGHRSPPPRRGAVDTQRRYQVTAVRSAHNIGLHQTGRQIDARHHGQALPGQTGRCSTNPILTDLAVGVPGRPIGPRPPRTGPPQAPATRRDRTQFGPCWVRTASGTAGLAGHERSWPVRQAAARSAFAARSSADEVWRQWLRIPPDGVHSAGSYRCSGRSLVVHRCVWGWGDGPAVGQQLPAVVEQHDTVAEQAPAPLVMGSHDAGGAVVRRRSVRAAGLMLAPSDLHLEHDPCVLVTTHDRASTWPRRHGRRPAWLPGSGTGGAWRRASGRRCG